jgi:hypothetical protein
MAPGCGLRRTAVAAGVAMETGPGVRVSVHVAVPGSASALTGVPRGYEVACCPGGDAGPDELGTFRTLHAAIPIVGSAEVGAR